MNILDISASAANKLLTPINTFYAEQVRWVDGKTSDFVILYQASNIHNELIISRCECKKTECLLDLSLGNACASESDAIAMALNAIV